jgi:hypothetical protein
MRRFEASKASYPQARPFSYFLVSISRPKIRLSSDSYAAKKNGSRLYTNGSRLYTNGSRLYSNGSRKKKLDDDLGSL